MAMSIPRGRVLVAGEAAGPLLRLAAPISFWGGVDAGTGRIADPRHPDHGTSIAGSVRRSSPPFLTRPP